MPRTTVALLAALEAAVAVLVGIGATVVPAVLVWAVRFGVEAPIDPFLRAAGDVWLLGHGVDVTMRVDEQTAAGIGLPGAAEPFAVTIALLGYALVTAAFGRRIGRRAAGAGHPFVGLVAAGVVAASLGLVTALLATADAARPDAVQAALLPAFAIGLGAAIGAVGAGADPRPGGDGPVRRVIERMPHPLVDGATRAWRIGAGSVAGLAVVASMLVAVLVVLDYATIAGLSQALGAGPDGGLAITVAQLALLPNLVVWAMSWLLGPGFALGAGTTVSPSVVLVGPMPGLPLLGAVPAEPSPLGVLWLALPVALGFAGAIVVGARPRRALGGEPWWQPAALGAGAGLVAGAVAGLLAWWSSGAAGPGRLAEVGPDPWPVALAAALSVAVGAVAGAYASWARHRHDAAWGDEPSGSDRAVGRPVGAGTTGPIRRPGEW